MHVKRQLVAVCVVFPLLSCNPSEPQVPTSNAPVSAPESKEALKDAIRLRLTFDRPAKGTQRAFDAGAAWPRAVVIESQPGLLDLVAGEVAGSGAVKLPGRCGGVEECPRALVELPDDDRLDPGSADFEFGAIVRLAPDETDVGSNIMQKGRFSTPGGQWKLQVDGKQGRPSCVVQGEADGDRTFILLEADQSIADNEWHRVSCTHADGSLTITVDEATKRMDAEVGSVRNSAEVRIGASGPAATDDQFHGTIDELTFCVPSCA